MMVKKVMLLLVLVTASQMSQAQYFLFSEDPETFPTEVINSLNRIDTESARKVASDFRSVWEYDLSETQRTKIIGIAKSMKEREMRLRPYFEYYFSYITYSIKQANISNQNLDAILDINIEAAKTSTPKEYRKFLLTLNLYFAREYIYYTRFKYVKAIGGDYQFDIAGLLAAATDTDTFDEDTATVDDYLPDDYVQDDSNVDDWFSDTNDQDNSWVDDDSSWIDDDPWGDNTTVDDTPQREVIASAGKDYVAEAYAKFNPPLATGPIIKLQDTDLQLVSKYDSLTVQKTSGTYELNGKNFLGSGGTATWSGELKAMQGASVEFGDYYFDVGQSEISTPYATLTFPQFVNKEVPGVFKYRSVVTRPKDRPKKNFPYFESLYSDVEVDLPFQGVSYTGGIAFRGQKMYGRSISRNLGTLTIRDGQGRTLIAKSQEFSFVDSLITSDDALIYLLHRNDTIYNPSVTLRYDPSKKQALLTVEL